MPFRNHLILTSTLGILSVCCSDLNNTKIGIESPNNLPIKTKPLKKNKTIFLDFEFKGNSINSGFSIKLERHGAITYEDLSNLKRLLESLELFPNKRQTTLALSYIEQKINQLALCGNTRSLEFSSDRYGLRKLIQSIEYDLEEIAYEKMITNLILVSKNAPESEAEYRENWKNRAIEESKDRDLFYSEIEKEGIEKIIMELETKKNQRSASQTIKLKKEWLRRYILHKALG